MLYITQKTQSKQMVISIWILPCPSDPTQTLRFFNHGDVAAFEVPQYMATWVLCSLDVVLYSSFMCLHLYVCTCLVPVDTLAS